MKYAWIHEHRDSFPIAVMCDVLAVSKSGYYASIDREPSPRAQRRERIKGKRSANRLEKSRAML